MDAGPQFDSLLARAIWKYIVVFDTQANQNFLVTSDHQRVPLPRYSTSVTDSHKVAEHFQALGNHLQVRSNIDEGNVVYQAVFLRNDGRTYRFSVAPTLPLAICRAALAALAGENIAK